MYPDTLEGIPVKSPAEKILFEALKSQLSNEFTVLYSVAWIGIRQKGKKPSDGEIDFVIMHPKMGILLLEVKGGIVGRDENGSWFSVRKDKSQVDIKNPFEQVKDNKYAFMKKIDLLPNYQYTLPTIGQAVAFPDGTVDDANLGADIPWDIVIQHKDLGNLEERIRACLKFWGGENLNPPGEQGVQILRNLFKKSWYLREPTIGEEIGIEHSIMQKYTEEQYALLDWLAGHSRAAIRGCAGSGKTLLAVKKAEQLAHEGFRTLLVCYNHDLAEYLKTITGKKARLKVRSFHGLCQEYADRTGRDKKPYWNEGRADFYDSIMPEALLEAAISEQDEYRFDAIVTDEGQDFSESWWAALEMLLADPENGVFYVFYDDNQLVYPRKMHLPVKEAPFPLITNCRNTRKIFEASSRYYRSDLNIKCKGPEGREPGVNSYDGSEVTIGAKLTEILARMIYEHNVPNTDLIVLSAGGLKAPPLDRVKNTGAIQLVPNTPTLHNEVQCTTIRLFKGLEKPVVILVEPTEQNEIKNELMYVGISRAVTHLELIIGPDNG
jgi:hypothetical protein